MIQPPPDADPQRQRSAQFMIRASYITMSLELIVLIGLTLATGRVSFTSTTLGAIFIIQCAALFMISRGYIYLPAIIVTACLFLITLIAPLFAGFVPTIALLGFVVVTLFAALTMGLMALITMAALSVLGWTLMSFLASMGIITSKIVTASALEIWIFEALVLSCIGVFLYLLACSLQGDYRQIKQQATDLQNMVVMLQATSVSKNYLDNIIGSMAELLVITSPDGCIQKVNRTARAILGYGPSDLLDKDIRVLFTEPLTAPQGVPQDTVITSRNGERIPVSLSVSTFTDSQDKILGKIYVAQDQRQLRQIKQDLAISTARYQTAVMVSSAGVLEWDVPRDTIYLDPNMQRLIGMETDTSVIPASELKKYIYVDDREALFNRIVEMRDKQETRFEAEYRLRRVDGTPVWVLGRGRVVYDSTGVPLHAVVANIDLNDRKAGEKLSLQNALERERERLLAEFVEASSHSFRTILNVITASAWLLRRIQDTEKREERLQIIEEQAYALKKLFDSMFTLLKLDSMPVLRLDPFDINVLLREVLYRIERYAQREQVSITTEFDVNAPLVMINGDELGLALMNLIENALTFNQPGGTVKITTSQTPDSVVITIEDSGIGIPPDKIEHIFDRMYKVDEARSRGGLGLGLSIAKRIVELHHGTINVKSREHEGSVFTVTLPKLSDKQKADLEYGPNSAIN